MLSYLCALECLYIFNGTQSFNKRSLYYSDLVAICRNNLRTQVNLAYDQNMGELPAYCLRIPLKVRLENPLLTNSRFIIRLNAFHCTDEPMRTAALAHEVGHSLFHRFPMDGENVQNKMEDEEWDSLQRTLVDEANLFASYVFWPKPFVEECIKNVGTSGTDQDCAQHLCDTHPLIKMGYDISILQIKDPLDMALLRIRGYKYMNF